MNRYWLLIMAILAVQLAQAATIYGTVYDYDLLVAKDVILEVNSTPKQILVSRYGNYELKLPPGEYALIAAKPGFSVTEHISVTQDGGFVVDLILFPVEDDAFPDELGVGQLFTDEPEGIDPVLYALAAGTVVVGLVIWLNKNRIERLLKRGPKGKLTDMDLPDDLRKVLKILAGHGNRISQKELVKELGLSEAKVSLMVADMESRDIVKKIKKGRGNILVLQGRR